MSRGNKKDWDLETLLSIVGFVFELVRVTVNALRQRNGTVDHLRRLLKEPKLVDQVFDLIVGRAGAVIATFKSLLEACHQQAVDLQFTESRWSLEPVAADEDDWEVVEHHFQNNGTLAEGLQELKRLAILDNVRSLGEFRLLAGSRRAMEYIAQHPDAQLDHPIILPLAEQDSSGYLCVPVFYRMYDFGGCGLDLRRINTRFSQSHSWLVLRRKQN